MNKMDKMDEHGLGAGDTTESGNEPFRLFVRVRFDNDY